MNIKWLQAPTTGAVWIQFKDCFDDTSGWAYLSLDQTEYIFIGIERRYEIEWFQEPDPVGKVYTNPAKITNCFIEGTPKKDPWYYDADQSSEIFISNENPEPGSTQGDIFIAERSPISVENRILVDIKDSAYTVTQERITDQQAQDTLDRMRADVEKTFGIPRRLL